MGEENAIRIRRSIKSILTKVPFYEICSRCGQVETLPCGNVTRLGTTVLSLDM